MNGKRARELRRRAREAMPLKYTHYGERRQEHPGAKKVAVIRALNPECARHRYRQLKAST